MKDIHEKNKGKHDTSDGLKSSNTPPKKNTFLKLLNIIVISGIWGSVIVGSLLGYLYLTMPLPQDLANKNERLASMRIVSNTGVYIASSGDGYGVSVSVDELPSYIPMAFVATEDHRFYEHIGIDFIGLARAIYTNVLAGRVKQGGSTISQQVAKNLFLSNKRSFERKIRELVYTIWLEAGFEKKEILTLYLNRVYMSNGQYGISAAANHYFGIPAGDLSVWQSAVLAGMLKAPNRYNPALSPKLSATRARVVLKKMVRLGVITQAQAEKAKQDTVKTIFSKSNANHVFTRYVYDEVSSILDVINQDIIVHTTLDVNYQKSSMTAITAYRTAFEEKGASQVAFLGMDTSGAIRSMIGSVDFKSVGFNRSTQARRQVGSLFKAFIYSKAMEKFEPSSRIKDTRYTIEGYSPRNYSRKYQGVVSLKYAYARSLNIPAIKLGQVLGRETVIDYAYSLGIKSKIENVRTLALGVSTASLLEMVGAFGAFSNEGYRVTPYSIERITDAQGREIYSRSDSSVQVISSNALNKFNEMGKAVINGGSGKYAHIPGVDMAGKTGTTQDYRDAWFVGYTNEHVAGVWLGNDDNTPTKKITGSSFPALIFKAYMRRVQQYNPAGYL